MSSTSRSTLGVGWGDSTIAGTGADSPHGPPWLTVVAGLTGFVMSNQGVSGNTSIQIKARFDANPSFWNRSTIILSGFNNSSSPSQVLSDTAAMVASLGHNRYLVLALWATDAPSLANITTINSGLLSAHGSHFYDPGLPKVSGLLDPTYVDSGVHMNTAGHLFMGTKIAQNVMHLLSA